MQSGKVANPKTQSSMPADIWYREKTKIQTYFTWLCGSCIMRSTYISPTTFYFTQFQSFISKNKNKKIKLQKIRKKK